MVPHLDTVATVRSLEHELALRSIEQRRRLAAPRTVFLPVACLLILATGGVLVILTLTLSAPARPVAAGTSPAEAIATVRAFYDATNEVLRTGNPAQLDVVVGSDLVEHADRPGLPPGKPGLVRYLSTLRAAYPTLRFEVDDLLVDNDQVSVRVMATTHLDRPGDQAGSWYGVDIFRMEDGRVVERWSGSDAPSLVHPLARVPVGLGLPQASQAAMARFTYAAGTRIVGGALPGPGMVVVESGVLTVRGNGVAQIFRAAASDPDVPPAVVPPGTDEVLHPGDAVAFLQGTSALHNDGLEPAVALAVAWFPNPRSETFERTMTRHGNPTDDGALALAMLPSADGGQPVHLAGIAIEPLGSLGLAQLAPGPVVVALDRALLSPGASLPPIPAGGPVLLAVEAGTFGLVPALDLARIRSGDGKATIATAGLEAPLTTGDSAVWNAGAVALVRGGDTAGAALLLAISSDAPVHPVP